MTPSQLAFGRLADIVAELREKCPWDRVQTKESIRPLTIEEAHELSEAVLKGDYAEIRAELGDLLLHVLFYAQLAQEEQKFTLEEVINGLIAKLIRRHPHIYGETQADDASQVRENWEEIKAKEKAAAGKVKSSVLDGVPESLPSLIKAQRIQEKASAVGFDWSDIKEVWAKVEEELEEVKEAESPEHRAEEVGDLLFAVVNYCRFTGISADESLERTNLKFKRRFEHIEMRAKEAGKSLKDMTLAEMDVYWNEAKG
ncbi:MAG: nucleoside triphosphate pyrophosphohydrolase [Bacteroidetes bacterium]|nr:MAG: nucleoside triphosphate pyrophosphohydrolase [Bacteroidota bacterium]